MLDLALRCRCRRVLGVARNMAASSSFRFICYCTDCQAFARVLERPDVLDAAGGTDIVQLPPGRVSLTAGGDALRCVQLSGKVLRWYTECCRTPLANTAVRPGFPLVGMIHSFIADEQSLDAVLGPPRCRIFERSATGPLPSNAPPPPSLRLFARRASMMLGWWMRGLGRPTSFFDEHTKAPRVEPTLLSGRARP